jgi:hypothetical protein
MGAVDVYPERLGAGPDGAAAGYHRSHHRSSSDDPQPGRRFDFSTMAQRSQGNRWRDLASNEKSFVAVFTDFVEHGYMSTLGSYWGEKVVYDGDRVKGVG